MAVIIAMNTFFYLAPIFIFFAIRFNSRVTRFDLLFVIGLCIKIILAYLMTYLIINKYDFGDLSTYYTFAKDISSGRYIDEIEFWRATHIVATFNSFIFRVFPSSIYGLATVTGISSFIYCYALIRSFENSLPKPYLFRAAGFLLFLPVLGIQSGYIGKETYVLPLLGYIFYSYSCHQRITAWAAISIVGVGIIRPYQALVFLVVSALMWLLFNNKKYSFRYFLLTIVLLITVLFLFGSWLYSNMIIIINVGAASFMADTYHGGNLTLDPFPQPFTVLQNFRPFFWEAHNLMSLVASIENMLILCFCSMFLLIYVGNRAVRVRLNSSPYFVFVALYASLYLLLFMYNSNIGDMSRRHIYYYPQLIFLAFSALSTRRHLQRSMFTKDVRYAL